MSVHRRSSISSGPIGLQEIFRHAKSWREAQPVLRYVLDSMEGYLQDPGIRNTFMKDRIRDWLITLKKVCP